MIFEVHELMDVTTADHIRNYIEASEDGQIPRQQMMLLMRKISDAEDRYNMTLITFFGQYAIFKKNL
jgi:hypothetical protein